MPAIGLIYSSLAGTTQPIRADSRSEDRVAGLLQVAGKGVSGGEQPNNTHAPSATVCIAEVGPEQAKTQTVEHEQNEYDLASTALRKKRLVPYAVLGAEGGPCSQSASLSAPSQRGCNPET